MDNDRVVAKVTACKRCDRPVTEVGRLSARKLCHGCGVAAVIGSIHQLQARTGPMYELWRRRTILALLDLDTPAGTSLDLISDEALAQLLSTGAADRLR